MAHRALSAIIGLTVFLTLMISPTSARIGESIVSRELLSDQTPLELSSREAEILKRRAAKQLKEEEKKKHEQEKEERKANQIFLPGMKMKHLHEEEKNTIQEVEGQPGVIDAEAQSKPEHHHATHKKKKTGILGLLLGTKSKKEQKNAAKQKRAQDAEIKIFSRPVVGTQVELQGLKKDFNGLKGSVTVIDTSSDVYNVRLEDGRELRKVKLAALKFVPPVGTPIMTRDLKDGLNGLKGSIVSVDSNEYCTVKLTDGRLLRRMKLHNMISLPPVGSRIRTKAMKKELLGKKGSVTATDLETFQITIQLDDFTKPMVVAPEKIEFDF